MAQYRKTHLMINGKMACGKSVYSNNTFAAGFGEFKTASHKCSKCEASKQYAFLSKENTKADIAKAEEAQATQEWDIGSDDDWEPETDKSWLVEDLKIIKAHQAKQKALTI